LLSPGKRWLPASLHPEVDPLESRVVSIPLVESG
jgi:hypothetical protein